MNDKINYSDVPHTFVYCGVTTCPQADACLRHQAWKCVPTTQHFLTQINTRHLEAMGNKCNHFLKTEKQLYAKGFTKMAGCFTVKTAKTFRTNMLKLLGYRNYYLTRKGERLLSPQEQEAIVNLAKKLGLEMEDYFDAYEYKYVWF